MRPIERRWLEETHGDEDLGKLDLTAMLGSELGGSVDDLTKALELKFFPELWTIRASM